MTDQPTHPPTYQLSRNQPDRCLHYTASGRRCRLPILTPGARLCFRHTQLHSRQPDSGDLRSALAGDLTEFSSAIDINDFLSRLLLLVAENRIAANRAAVMAGICSLLLRTLMAIERDEVPQIIFDDSPGPDPVDTVQPS